MRTTMNFAELPQVVTGLAQEDTGGVGAMEMEDVS